MPSVFLIECENHKARIISQKGEGGLVCIKNRTGRRHPRVRMVVPDQRDERCRAMILWATSLRRPGLYLCRDDKHGRPKRVKGAAAVFGDFPSSPQHKSAERPLKFGAKTFRRLSALREHATMQLEERLARFA